MKEKALFPEVLDNLKEEVELQVCMLKDLSMVEIFYFDIFNLFIYLVG